MLEGVWKTETKKKKKKKCKIVFTRNISPQSRLSWAQLVSGGRTHQTPKESGSAVLLGQPTKIKQTEKKKKKENR